MPLTEPTALTGSIIGAAIEVHRHLGPGLLEASYSTCLRHELTICGLPFRAEVQLPLAYKGVALDAGYRLDLIVGEEVVVEVKAVESILPVHKAQLLTYMRLTSARVGLLFNFNVPVLRQGVRRMVLSQEWQ